MAARYGEAGYGDDGRHGQAVDAPLAIADRFFESRMLVGTGKFASHLLMRQAVLASGAEIV
ncbi:MAG: thiazole synthase, partial [Frankiaceae bacterium]